MYLSTGFLGKSKCPLPQSSMPRLSVPICGVTRAARDTLPCPQHGIPKNVSLAQLSELQESVICISGKQKCDQGKGKWAAAPLSLCTQLFHWLGPWAKAPGSVSSQVSHDFQLTSSAKNHRQTAERFYLLQELKKISQHLPHVHIFQQGKQQQTLV